ncbi:MAG: hypothetical protein ACOVOC_15865, partial [Rhabdaerophilum sp.]
MPRLRIGAASLLWLAASGMAAAENFAFAPAPQQDLNRIYRIDRLSGEVIACQFAVKDDSPIGL